MLSSLWKGVGGRVKEEGSLELEECHNRKDMCVWREKDFSLNASCAKVRKKNNGYLSYPLLRSTDTPSSSRFSYHNPLTSPSCH